MDKTLFPLITMDESKRKNHTQLLCDVGELSGLFHDATSLESFLQRIVEMVGVHLNAEVCSVYLFYEDTQELELRATKGLNRDNIGKVKLKLGEGLTGLALKELRPVCEQNASRNKNFKYFPALGEDNFESFLAVPIVRGRSRIGVMVIQNSRKNFFSEEDIRVLKAITSQLANTIEMTRIILAVEEEHDLQKESYVEEQSDVIKGQVGSSGVKLGPAVVVGQAKDDLIIDTNKTYTYENLEHAFAETERQLKAAQNQIEEKLSDVASLIFSAQILMLKDKTFVDAIRNAVSAGENPPLAIQRIVNQYTAKFEKISNPYIREKAQDVRDIGRRLIKNITGQSDQTSDITGKIIIAKELLPSDALKYSSQEVQGIIVLRGGATGHLAILAQSLQIPLIIADVPSLLRVEDNTEVLMDGSQGIIYINPTKEVKTSYKDFISHVIDLEKLQREVSEKTQTADGKDIHLYANINLLHDLEYASAFKAEGVGLYRTEFPFIVRSSFPTEEEQFVIYKKLIEGMKGKSITIRTLDIGGDKALNYFQDNITESNPFLGLRSIRFSLKYQDVFQSQIRAILRAGAECEKINIMFPMISSLDEFLDSKKILQAAMAELQEEQIDYCRNVRVGLMIEIPSVVSIMDDLAQEADFFSIGSNDFVQYMLAVDRTNEKVSYLYVPHHPSVLRALSKIVSKANEYKKDISLCGDMAHDERYLEFLIGIGLKNLSLNPQYIPRVQRKVKSIDAQKAQASAKKILTMNSLRELNEVFRT